MLKKFFDAFKNNKIDALNEILSDDFIWIMHSVQKRYNKVDFIKFSKSDKKPFKINNERIIYENNEIAVGHSFVEFHGGLQQAVLQVIIIKDNKIIEMETGASTIQNL